MRVLVTGGAGFIGSNLVAHLRASGHDVLVVDLHGDPPADLLHPGSIAFRLKRFAPDVVVHLAAKVGRLFGESDVRETVRANAEITTAIAHACGKAGVRVAYASTSEVYGDRGEQVCHEDDPLTVLPHNLYGLSKRWGEEACQLYTPDPVIFRFSMPYGPGVPPGRGRRALDTMLWQAHHGLPITVHRGAERSWCWIGDTVAGIMAVLESGQGGAWNIGRDDAYVPMIDLAERCRELAGSSSPIEVVDPPGMQTIVKRLSTSKLRGLGWAPTVELDEGLGRMLEWVSNFDEKGQWNGSQVQDGHGRARLGMAAG